MTPPPAFQRVSDTAESGRLPEREDSTLQTKQPPRSGEAHYEADKQRDAKDTERSRSGEEILGSKMRRVSDQGPAGLGRTTAPP